jgi:hypothetical protein
MLTRIVRRSSLLRVTAIVLPAAVLATAFAVGPSFAGSFLTNHKAKRIYLTKKTARKDYVKKSGLPDVPISDALASTSLFRPKKGTAEPVIVPGSKIVLDVPETRLLTLTFSGVSECTAGTNGAPCPVGVLVDGQPASTGVVNFDASGNQGPVVHTLTQTSIVTAGEHTINVEYAGSADPSVKFKLYSWNLVAEAVPST